MNSNLETAAEIWSAVADRLKKSDVSRFDSWFKPLQAVGIRDGVLVLSAPDRFFALRVGRDYGDLIRSELAAENRAPGAFELVVPERASERVAVPSSGRGDAPSGIRPPASPRPAHNIHVPTFENFVWSEENRYSYMAARTAAESPGSYNPLYIYGGSGVGKSHLLHAIANYVKRNSPGTRVRYIACSELLNEYYDLLVNKKDLRELRNSMRDVDILLVDDVHTLANKTALQEEIFGVFNSLYSCHRQIVFTSDKQPCEIAGLQPRLVTRFESGVTTEIAVPAYEGRLAILKMMRSEQKKEIQLSDELLDFLAMKISSSVRRLKGAFMRLTALVSMSGKMVTLDRAAELLGATLTQECSCRTLSMEEIQRKVAEHFSVRLSDLLGERRPKNIAEPRMAAMYLCRKLTSHSLTEIGEAFGKNHATVINAMKKVPELCSRDESLKMAIMSLERSLKG